MPVDTSTKRKRKKISGPRLTTRDRQLLAVLHYYGGCMETIALSDLLWTPDLARRLTGWGVTPEQAQTWLAECAHSDLYDKVEQLKWGQSLNRLRHSTRLTKADQKVVAWLDGLESDAQRELVSWLDNLEAQTAATWLAVAITQDSPAPHAFNLWERQPHEAVSSACKRRLRHLKNLGLIEMDEQPSRLADGRAQGLWFLTRKGHNLLAQIQGVKPGQLDWKPVGAYGAYHLTHRLVINRFRVAVERACVQKGYTLVRWLDDNQLKRMLAKEKVTLLRRVRDPKSGTETHVEERHSLKIPDGYFVLDMGEAGQRHCFFELDNQTLTLRYREPNPKEYAQKIRTLTAYYKSGRYQELFPEAGQSMWLLTVTTGSRQRMQNLKETAEKVLGQNRAADRYWFACMDDIPTWENPFSTAVFDPIWQRAGQERTWRLDETI